MGKPVKYVVEGVNFLATVVVDEEICGEPHMEAATKTIENVFRHGPDTADEFGMLLKKGDKPAFGVVLGVCEEGKLGMPEDMRPISTTQAAQNAGVLELVRKGKLLGWT